MEKLAFLECQSTIQDTKIGMLPGQCGQVLLHMWDVAHMETLFIGRERAERGWKQDYTDLSLHCAKTRYLQSVLSTFIKLQHNPESTDWKQYFLHFNYRRSWLDGAVWPQYHSLTNQRKQSLKFAQTYWHILLFSNSTERELQTQ